MKGIQPLADLINMRAAYIGEPTARVSTSGSITGTQKKIIDKFDELILKCVEAITLEA